jgi:hypothetical protein
MARSASTDVRQLMRRISEDGAGSAGVAINVPQYGVFDASCETEV